MIQIRRVILYGRNGKVRPLEFRLGELNIISGDSKTGKSALIDIIDYCLGCKDCSVAEGVIRNKVRYYAVVLAKGEEDIFICRPDPPTPQLTSQEIMVVVGKNLGTPDLEFKQNFNPESLKAFLSEQLGITDNLSEPGITRKALEANFRHALTFCFQEQGEIAQRGFLFHGSSDNFVHLAIRDTLSYFLGAIEDERPILRAELRAATRILTLAERRLEEAITIGGEGLARGQALLTEARQLGLDNSTEQINDKVELHDRLQNAVEAATVGEDLPDLPGDERQRLSGQRAHLMERVANLRAQIEAYRAIGRDETGYTSALNEQKQRLESIGLFSSHDSNDHECPVCGSSVELPSDNDFQSALKKLSEELQGVEATKPKLDTVIQNLEVERAAFSQQLAQNRLELEALTARDEELRRTRDILTARARVSGRISLYLESGALNVDDEHAPLKKAIERAKANVESPQQKLDSEVVDSRLESILSLLNRDINAMAAELQLEHSGNPLRFDPEKLTVIADTINGPVPMVRMGSGENWVSYHVLIHLALHRWFHQNSRPVPRFLVLDQPSQVYFPSDTTSERDVDMNSVRRIYQLILRVAQELNPDLQVIITDHVNDPNAWFQDAVIEEWRNGKALIQADWLV